MKKPRTAYLNDKGQEVVDSTPLEIPLGMKRPPTMQEQIQRILAGERAQRYMQEHDLETPEEADDFDIDDDPEPVSQYEFHEMIEEIPVPPAQREAPEPSLPHNEQGGDEGAGGEKK